MRTFLYSICIELLGCRLCACPTLWDFVKLLFNVVIAEFNSHPLYMRVTVAPHWLLILSIYVIFTKLTAVKWYFTMILSYICPFTNEIDSFIIHLLAIQVSCSVNCLSLHITFHSFFLLVCLFLIDFGKHFISSQYYNTNLSSVICFINTFLKTEAFQFLEVSLRRSYKL